MEKYFTQNIRASCVINTMNEFVKKVLVLRELCYVPENTKTAFIILIKIYQSKYNNKEAGIRRIYIV